MFLNDMILEIRFKDSPFVYKIVGSEIVRFLKSSPHGLCLCSNPDSLSLESVELYSEFEVNV